MARIRSIHPGIFSDEAFMALTVDHPLCIPLLFGLWTEADDDGVFEWKPLTLKAKALPAAPVDMDQLMTVLVDLNFIMKFEASGKAYGAIRNFKTWQRPKLPKVKYPKSADAAAYVGADGETLTHDLPSDGEKSPQRKEEGGKRKEVKKEGGASAPATEYAFVGRVIKLSTSDFDQWRKNYPLVSDLVAELTKADAYYADNPPPNGKWFFAVSSWLKRENENRREAMRATGTHGLPIIADKHGNLPGDPYYGADY